MITTFLLEHQWVTPTVLLLLIAFGDDPKAAKAVYIGGPVLAALMIGGWFLVRGRINPEAFDDEASRMS